MHARGLLGRPRESNLTSVFHSATRLGSVTSWEASDATHLSTQRLHASISHHYHLRQRSNHRKAFPILHAHCDPSPPSLEVKEQPSANIEEKEQHHNHVRAPARARACKANECRKWTTQRRFTTTQRHASTRRSSAARCLRAAVPAELEPDCGYSSFFPIITSSAIVVPVQLRRVRAHCYSWFWMSRLVKESCPWLYS